MAASPSSNETESVTRFEGDDAALAALFRGHRLAAERQCLSSVTVAQVAGLGKPFTDAVAAALLTLGTLHAPIEQAYALLIGEKPTARDMLGRGKRVPGWGSAFVKGKPDATWSDVRAHLDVTFIDSITRVLGNAPGGALYPNAAAYTAQYAIQAGIPMALAPALVVEARLLPWQKIYWANHTSRL